MKMTLPAMLITSITTQLNTGMSTTQLISLIQHFTAMCVMGYMHMTGQVRWIAWSWGMIDAAHANLTFINLQPLI